MNSIRFICFALIASTTIQAGDIDVDELVQKRIALLTKIHESTKTSYSIGAATEDQVRDAALALYTFQRDAATSLADRVKWQEQIVAAEKVQKGSIEKRMAQGTAAPVEGLRAEERLLAAQQKLLEIKTSK